MKLEYYGHSCFRLTFASGTRIVTDPYGEIGYAPLHTEAEVVTLSHSHYDHCNVAAVGGAPEVFSSPVSCERGGVRIDTVSAFHDDACGAKRGKNLIFRFRADGLDICHLGDLGEPVNARLLRELRGADVVLIPVGGHYTVDAAQAVEYVRALKPKVVIPMHYYTEGLQVDVAGVQNFLSLCPASSIVTGGGEIGLSGDFVASQSQKIIVMERIKHEF